MAPLGSSTAIDVVELISEFLCYAVNIAEYVCANLNRTMNRVALHPISWVRKSF